MKAHISAPSPLTQDRLKEEQVNLYIFLVLLHKMYGFGKKRLTDLLWNYAESKSEYDKRLRRDGKWSADSELLHDVQESFGGVVGITDLIGK